MQDGTLFEDVLIYYVDLDVMPCALKIHTSYINSHPLVTHRIIHVNVVDPCLLAKRCHVSIETRFLNVEAQHKHTKTKK